MELERNKENICTIGGILMNLTDLQKDVLSFVSDNNLETTVETRLLDLVSEVGELSKEILKGSDYGKEEFQITSNLSDEFGDVLFSLICIANSTDVDLEKALKAALYKYRKRIEQTGQLGSGR